MMRQWVSELKGVNKADRDARLVQVRNAKTKRAEAKLAPGVKTKCMKFSSKMMS
jgi:hypothetical protein